MLIKIRRRRFEELVTGLAYTIIGILGLVTSLFFNDIFDKVPACLFQQWSGIPCPSCGATHAGYFLSHLMIKKAFFANPFFFTLYILLMLWALNTLFGLFIKNNLTVHFTAKERKACVIVVTLFFFLSWAFTVIRACFL